MNNDFCVSFQCKGWGKECVLCMQRSEISPIRKPSDSGVSSGNNEGSSTDSKKRTRGPVAASTPCVPPVMPRTGSRKRAAPTEIHLSILAGSDDDDEHNSTS